MKVHAVLTVGALTLVAACSAPESSTSESQDGSASSTTASSTTTATASQPASASPVQDLETEAEVERAATRAVQRVDAVFNDPAADLEDLKKVATGDYLAAVRKDIMASRQQRGEPLHRHTDVLGVLRAGADEWRVPACVEQGEEGTVVHLTVRQDPEGLKLTKAETYGQCGGNDGNQG